MVFLRPVVMRDADSTSKFSLDRYDRIRGQQQETQPTPSVVLPVDEAPVLPASPQGTPPFAPEPPKEKAPPAVRQQEAP
jgi:general secretion pathway protein D